MTSPADVSALRSRFAAAVDELIDSTHEPSAAHDRLLDAERAHRAANQRVDELGRELHAATQESQASTSIDSPADTIMRNHEGPMCPRLTS